MVDSISGKNIQESSLINIGQQPTIEKVNAESAQATAPGAPLQTLDQATISDEAKKAYESEREVLRFSRLAQKVKEPFNSDKVAHFKNLLDSGRINEYLRSLNNDALADSLLSSPSGAFLR